MRTRKMAGWTSIVAAVCMVTALSALRAKAQDFDQYESSDFEPEHGGGHHHLAFNVTGKVVVMQTTPCPTGDTCFSFNGTVHDSKSRSSLSGQGSNSNCNTNGKTTCCTTSGTQTAVPSGGTIEFSFAGMSCSSSPKKETVKLHLMVTGGSGKFTGAMGSGKETIIDDPATGHGTVTANGTLSN